MDKQAIKNLYNQIIKPEVLEIAYIKAKNIKKNLPPKYLSLCCINNNAYIKLQDLCGWKTNSFIKKYLANGVLRREDILMARIEAGDSTRSGLFFIVKFDPINANLESVGKDFRGWESPIDVRKQVYKYYSRIPKTEYTIEELRNSEKAYKERLELIKSQKLSSPRTTPLIAVKIPEQVVIIDSGNKGFSDMLKGFEIKFKKIDPQYIPIKYLHLSKKTVESVLHFYPYTGPEGISIDNINEETVLLGCFKTLLQEFSDELDKSTVKEMKAVAASFGYNW